jgi:predicted phosphodiesterase
LSCVRARVQPFYEQAAGGFFSAHWGELSRFVKRALISDIHSNLEALEAVLADIRQQGIQEVYCLGDIIGYGPNPRECIDLVMNCNVCLLGNHDQGALFDPEGFNTGAERAIFWTRDQLESPDGDPEENARRWDFLGELPRNRRENGFLFVHGSARNPLNEYVFPEDIYNQRKMEKIFSLIEHHCFQGHTHVPGVFTQSMNFISPEEVNYTYRLGDEKTMVNVGSVGQPRDGDPRSCYVVLEGNQITFRRIEYDFEKTIKKIYDTPELDNFLGDRLREGR